IKHFIDEGLSITNVLKPLLKGTFDIHGYLTRNKATARNIMTEPVANFGQLSALQWPEMDALELQPSIPMSSLNRQTDEIDLTKQTQQDASEVAPYQSAQLLLNAGNGIAERATIGQFIRPGLIDARYNRNKKVVEVAAASEQSASC